MRQAFGLVLGLAGVCGCAADAPARMRDRPAAAAAARAHAPAPARSPAQAPDRASSPLPAAAPSGASTPPATPGGGNPGEWTLPARDYDASRYSPLSQITPANAGRLRVIWSFTTGALRGH